ncbi:hypothetical protein [Thermus filiformis]|nr:hypothetical protein [Thermus filiformis]
MGRERGLFLRYPEAGQDLQVPQFQGEIRFLSVFGPALAGGVVFL